MLHAYSCRVAARLLKIPEARLRRLAEAAALGRRTASGDLEFRDLLVLRMVKRLDAAGASPRQLQRALRLLRRSLPARQHLASARLVWWQGRLLRWHGRILWELDSGQGLLPLARASPATTAAAVDARAAGAVGAVLPLRSVPALAARAVSARVDVTAADAAPGWRPPFPLGSPRAADAWFDAALAGEKIDLRASYELYLRALACDPTHVEALVNLGRLCCAVADLRRAAAYLRQALALDPAHAIAWFNLGVVLQDRGETLAAMEAYQDALLQDPRLADAHYNLAALCASVGDQEQAQRHRCAYRATRQI